MVGRAAELAELVAIVHGARQGQGAVVGLKGDAGLGKSRVKRAVADVARSLGMRVLEGSARREGDRAYGAIAAALSHALGIPLGATDAQIRLVVHEEGARLEVREADRAHLANVLGVDVAGTPLSHLDGRTLRRNNMLAVRAWLQAISRSCPQLLALEDMHGADALTRETVEYLSREVGLSRTAVLLLYRRGYTPPAYAREMVLPALSPEGSHEVLRALWVSGKELCDDVARAICESSEGNPLYIEEAVRLLEEVDGPSGADLPGGLHELLAARLHVLPDDVRHVAEVAAVVGVWFDPDVLAHIDELWPHAVPALESLSARGIVSRAVPGEPYSFRSALMRDVIYASIPAGSRRELHRLVAGSLQSLQADGVPVPAEQIGLHLSRSGNREGAAAAFLQAALRAHAGNAHADAERLFRAYFSQESTPSRERVEARLHLARVQEVSGWPQEAAETYRLAIGEAQRLRLAEQEAMGLRELAVLSRVAGRMDESQTLLDEALEIARRLGDAAGEAEVLRNMAMVCKQRGRVGQARVLYEQALSIHRARGARAAEAMLLGSLAALDHEEGQLQRAAERNRAALALHRAQGDRRGEAVVLGNIASLAREQGRMEEARDMYEAAIAVHREVGDRRSLGVTLYNLANLHGDQGRLEAAEALAEQALRVHREVGNRSSEGATLGYLAALHQEKGDAARARELFEEAIAIQREVQYWPFVAVNLGCLAELHREDGQVEEARRLLDEALTLHRRVKDRRGEALGLVKLAALEASVGRVAEAGDLARQSLAIHADLEDRRGQAISLVTLAQVCRLEGRRSEDAEPLLGQAERLLASIGDRLETVSCHVERGHLALAEGRSAERHFEIAEELVGELGLGPSSPARRRVDRLGQAMAMAGRGGALVAGEVPPVRDVEPRAAAR